MTRQKGRVRPKVLAAVPTPFSADGALDTEAAAELYGAVAASGVDGIFVVGTTGEFPTLSLDERKLLVELALKSEGEAEIFPHVGAASSREAAMLARHAIAVGADKVAAVTPFYYAAGSAELEKYYRSVAEAAARGELYVYSIPSRAGNRIDADLLRRLLDVPNLAGVKASVPDTGEIRELADVSRERLAIYAGEDAIALHALQAGACGLVSGPGSAVPEPYLLLAEAVYRGDEERARKAQQLIGVLARDIGGDIGRIKFALEVRGLPGGHLRAALAPPTQEVRTRVERAIEMVLEAAGAMPAAESIE